MKTQIITFGLFLAALTYTSCKNNETPAPETTVTTVAPTQADSTKQSTATVVKDSVKTAEKAENEANEKNEKE